jgi:putative transcriptional regulator
MITPVSAPCLLIAMPSMQDSNFSQSVLLLAEHNPEGAIAFVLNRPSTVSLKSMISLIDRDVPEAIPAWYGGPVDTTTAIILHDREPSDGDTEISPGIYLSTTGRILDSLIDHSTQCLQSNLKGRVREGDTLHPYRFLVGYAGWGPGQLDDELRAGAWLLVPLDRKFVFDTAWGDLWSESVQRVGLPKTMAVSQQRPIGHQGLLN